jgi:para-nitrobenzyl esterase
VCLCINTAFRTSRTPPHTEKRGAIHADDLPYYFDTVAVKYGAGTNATDKAIGKVVSSYVVNFVKTGDPNGASLPRWPVYRGKDGNMMDLSPGWHRHRGSRPVGE